MIFASRFLRQQLLFFILVLCNQTFAMQKLSVKDCEQQCEHDKEKIKRPLVVPQFKQQTVLLPADQTNGYSLLFNVSKEPCITHYQLGGKPIARLLQMGDSFRFQDNDIEPCDFLLQNQLKAELLAIVTKGKFTFQKPVKTSSASLVCKGIEFLDKFSSKNGLSIDVDYCDDFGDISCNEMIFKGNQLNVMTDVSLTAQSMAALLLKKGFFNDGKVSCAGKAIMTAPSFENWGSLILNNLGFESDTFLNQGDLDVQDSLQGSCESWDHRGRLKVQNDCVLEKIGTLSISESAKWNIGKCWKAYINRFYLDGKASVGTLALLSIGLHAQFDGSLHAPIIHVDSNDLITCNSTAQLIAAHYVGLKAKGWLQFDGDIFKKFLQKDEQSAYAQKLGAFLEMFPRGIFLTSEQSGIKKTGSIIARTGTVSLDAKKGLMHTGVTQAGSDQQAALFMNAASLKLEKDSLLDALNARLNAQTSLDQLGKARIQQLLMMEASDIGHHGSTKAETLCAKAANIKASASSQINVEKAIFEAQKKINHAGSLVAAQQLVMNAHDIDLKKTSHIDTSSAQFKANESINNQGNLNALQLLEHARYVTNSGKIKADRAHIKADRRWWNQWGGIVDVTESCNIDALASCNTFGAVQARDLTINSAIDFNLLGLYRAKNTHINSLIALNAGVLVPKFDSLSELLSKDNAKKAAWCLFTKFVPQAGLIFSLKSNVENIYHQGGALYEQCQHLYGNEDAGASDIISLLCGMKNVGMSVYQTGQASCQAYSMAKQGWKATQQTYQTISSQEFQRPSLSEIGSHIYSGVASHIPSMPWKEETDQATSDIASMSWKEEAAQATSDIAALIGPQVNRDALLDVNCGGTFGINGQSHSLFNANCGVSGFANRNAVNTYSGVNRGVMGAAVLNVNAKETYASTGAIGACKLSAEAKNLDVDGQVGVVGGAILKADEKATIGADVNANTFDVNAKTAELKKAAHCVARGGEANVVANNITSDATVHGKHVSYFGTESVTLGKDSTVTSTEKTVVVSKNADIGGKINAGGAAFVKAEEKAIINADVSGEHAVVEAKDAELKKGSNFVAREGLASVAADNLTSNATVHGKQVQYVGKLVTLGKDSTLTGTTEATVLADNLDASGKINSGGTALLKANNKAVVDADIEGNHAVVQAKDAELKKGSHLIAREGLASVAADQINSKAFIQGNQTQVVGKQISLGEGSYLSSHDGNDSIFVQATEKLDLHKGSTIDGGAVGIDAKSVHGEDGNIIRSRNGGYLKTEQINNQGTMQGDMLLQFNGKREDLTSIGHVEHLQYQGTLENNLADTLAQGNNDLLHVQKAGSITFLAGEQDVRFKENHHNLQHSLRAKTDGSVFCDQTMTTQESFVFDAKKDIHHKTLKAGKLNYMKAAGKVIDTAQIERIVDGVDYEDHFKRSEVTGLQVYIEGKKGIEHFGTKVHSGIDGTVIVTEEKFLSKAAQCEKYTEQVCDPVKKRKTTTTKTIKNTNNTVMPSEYTSDGVTTIIANFSELEGTIFDSKGGTVICGEVNHNEVSDTHVHKEEFVQEGPSKYKWHEKNKTKSARVVEFRDKVMPILISDKKISLPFKCNASDITLNAPEVEVSLGRNITTSEYDEKGVWMRAIEQEKYKSSCDITYTSTFDGTIHTNAKDFIFENVKGRPDLKIEVSCNDIKIRRRSLEEVHEHQKFSKNRPTKAALSVITLAVGLATAGLGAYAGAGIATGLGIKTTIATAIVTNLTAAASASLMVQATEILLTCDGDFKEAAKRLASADTFKKIFISSLTAVAMVGGSHALNAMGLPAIHEAQNFSQRVAYTAPRQIVNAGINTVGNIALGHDPKDAAVHNLKLAAAGTVGVACSNQIGDMYAKNQIDPFTHKVLHTGVGAIEGLIIDGPRGVAAGALGAGVSETIADMCKPLPPSIDSIKALEQQYGRRLTQAEFTQEWNKKFADYMCSAATVADISRFAATSVALFTQQDTNIAHNAASIAVDNNFLILAAYGVAAVSIAYTAYDIYSTYQNDGTEAALKQLGIEFLVTVGTAGAVRFGGLALFKVGKKAYPTAESAIKAALKHSPGLQIALDGVTDFTKNLAQSANKLLNTKAGRQVVRVHEHVVKFEQKLVGAENKVVQKIGQQLAAGCQSFGDNFVPESVLSKVDKLISTNHNIEEIANALSKIDLNKINHILTPKTGKHAWDKIITEEVTWEKVKPIIEKVMLEGALSNKDRNIFERSLQIGNKTVEVRFIELKDKSLSISNAWVKTCLKKNL